MEAPPDRFEKIIEGLRDAGINVIQAGTERYSEGLTVILSGHVIDTDVSDTLSRIQESSNASVTDLSLAAPEGTANVSSARIGIAAEAGAADVVIERLRDVAAEKDLTLIEPLAGATPA